MEPYSEENYKNCTIQINWDVYPNDPLEDWEICCELVCQHRNYTLGTKHDVNQALLSLIEKYAPEKYDEYLSYDEMFNIVESTGKVYMLPISMYDHSGITVYFGSPNDPWDSGYIGFGYMEKETVFKELGQVTEDNWKDKANEYMEGVMKVYDSYVRGNVFYWRTFDEDGDEIESMYGYYGMSYVEEMISEAKGCIDTFLQCREEKHNALLPLVADIIQNLIGSVFVCGRTVYRISTNLFGDACIERSTVKGAKFNMFDDVRVQDIPYKDLVIICN